jgi:hypothetical protein
MEVRLIHIPPVPLIVWWTNSRTAGQLVDKSLVRSTSNIYSKTRLKGPTFTVELAWGAISGTVPGVRTDDREAAGQGPGDGSATASNRDCRFASRRTGGSFGHFFVRPKPQGTIDAARSQASGGRPRGCWDGWPAAAACASREGVAAREWPDALLGPAMWSCNGSASPAVFPERRVPKIGRASCRERVSLEV